jgi:putative nucleotidyltransferase with HDIG domain
MPTEARILVINDDQTVSRFLREKLIVEGGFFVSFAPGGKAGLEALRQNSFDLVITKFEMPDLNGIDLLKGLKKIDPDCIIIVLVNEDNPFLQKEIFKLGAYDVILKPINLEKLFFLTKKGTELHSLMAAHRKLNQGLQEQNTTLQKQNLLLAKRIEESTKNLTRLYEDLRSTYMRTIKVLAQAIDARDHYTHSHSENVTKYATTIAEEMGLSAHEVETIREACELHDLGKIGIEDSILSKPSSLTPQEWEQIKRHPVIGSQILEPLTFLSEAIDLIRQHHEHYDGSGYPEGRRGEDILLGARIIHLADAYESMRSARSYRNVPLSKEEAIAEIQRNSGRQFDPKVVEVFLRVVDRLG